MSDWPEIVARAHNGNTTAARRWLTELAYWAAGFLLGVLLAWGGPS